jgi:pheromone shutdown protein TraB
MEMQNDPALKKEMEEMKTEEVFTQILSAVQEFNPDKFKRSLAPMLSEAEGFVTKLEGKDGTVIITERNKIVMESVKEQVAKGHRKIAVFYGAGHMPDLQTRLETEGFKPAGNTWMTAWNIGNSATSVTGLDLLENVLKDDSVVESVISIFRTFAGENLLQPSN